MEGRREQWGLNLGQQTREASTLALNSIPGPKDLTVLYIERVYFLVAYVGLELVKYKDDLECFIFLFLALKGLRLYYKPVSHPPGFESTGNQIQSLWYSM